jgi:hypothetical protein
MVLTDVYQLPWSTLQHVAHYMARLIGNMAWLLFQFPALSAYRLSGAKWTIIFVGTRENSLKQICHLFFEEEFVQEKLGKISMFKLSVKTRKWQAEGVDLIVCELGCLFPNRPTANITFTTPIMIHQVVPIPENLEMLLSGKKLASIRNKVNRGKRLGFEYRFSQSLADFDNFHYNMYLPFIKSRHGDLASISSYEMQRRWFVKGGLLLVIHNEKPVAGSLCLTGSDTYYAMEMGVLEGNAELIRMGIVPILKWYAIGWAHKNELRIYNMGPSHALSSNPAFTSKRRWGARVVKQKRIDAKWTFLASKVSHQLRSHLNKLGFVTEIDEKFYRVFLETDNSVGTQAVANDELLAAEKEGLDGLVVISADSEPVICDLRPEFPTG